MSKDTAILRLAKPKKKGLLRLLFSRFFLFVLLLASQIFLFASAYRWFRQIVPYYTVLQTLYVILMITYLFNNGMDSSAKLTWLFLLALFPIPASLLLAYTKTNFGHRSTKARIESLIEKTKHALPQDETVLAALAADHSGTDDLHRYINRSGCFPIYTDTEVSYFPLGENKFDAMLAELKKAEKFIFLEYFIIEEGEMWGRILEILIEKAAQGVDVRVMYDGTCEVTTLPHDYPRRLMKHGIKAKMFAPMTPFLSTHYNYRDHRKILVIDGNVAFNGGVNLADEYINRRTVHGHWKDAAVMLRGAAVRSFTLMFLQMWNIGEAAPDFSPADTAAEPAGAAGYVMPYGDCPLDEDKVGESVYIDILYRANRYVHIMTPYLILDGELEAAIRYAAERGIDVRLILPGVPDKTIPYALAKSHYRALLAAGVRIYEYTPGFVHAKVFVSDDVKAVVGTINLDYRSLYHHFECATYLYQVPCIREIEADFTATLEKCREITPALLREMLPYRLLGGLVKSLAPLV